MTPTDRAAVFDRYRPLLLSIAYRMLGGIADAEDVVQEAYLRWEAAPRDEVRAPKAFLSKVVTRMCIDLQRSARVRREVYVGPWLPEPLLEDRYTQERNTAAAAETLSVAFLVLLESLSPLERAVFLLRAVFDFSYQEIAAIVGKSPQNCRQIATRARQQISQRRRRYRPTRGERNRVVERFAQACTDGDLAGLLQLLAPDVELRVDGGEQAPTFGRARALRKPLTGRDRVAAFSLGVVAQSPEGFRALLRDINGELGIVGLIGERVVSALTLDIDRDSIRGIYLVVSPDKLAELQGLV
jgi:RNA polymerase sigma-70 factor (ECF subfamily)